MNSVSPVRPLDARRMCSRSERFIPAQNAHPLVLRHDDRKRAAVPHAESVLAAVGEFFQDARQTTRTDQVEPLLQGIFRMNGIIRIGEAFFNPPNDQVELLRIAPQYLCHNLVHFVAAFFDELVPVHSSKLTTLGVRMQRFEQAVEIISPQQATQEVMN